MEGVSLGVAVVAGGSWKEEVGCQEEEVGMGTRMHWAGEAEEVLVGQQHHKILYLRKKKSLLGDGSVPLILQSNLF